MSMPEPVLIEYRRVLREASSERGAKVVWLSFPEHAPTPDELFEIERAAFAVLLSTLIATHPGEFVAIHGGRAVTFGNSDTEVAQNFFREYGDTHVYIGFIGHEPPAFQIRPKR